MDKYGQGKLTQGILNLSFQFSDFEIRWPIPETKLQLNTNLIQNEGY